MKAYVCGQWDGNALWVQWDDFAKRYRLRLRFRKGGAAWSEWQRVQEVEGLPKSWAVVAVQVIGYEFQVHVGDHEVPDGAWICCREVTFKTSRCRFRIASDRDLMLGKERVLSAVVDGAPCHYVIPQMIEVKAGVPVELELESHTAEGWMQLDYPGHFTLNPRPGLVIKNLGPSEDDVVETGRESTIVEAKQRTRPLLFVTTGVNHFHGIDGDARRETMPGEGT